MSIKDFIQGLENEVFCKESIYRTILIVNNEKEKLEIQEYLNMNDYSLLVINDIDTQIDYETIYKRIVVLNYETYKEFIYHLKNINDGIESSSYNCLGISFSINENRVHKIKQLYLNSSKNNMNKCIIYDKHYRNIISIHKRL